MRRRAPNGKHWPAWLPRASAQLRPDATIFILAAVAAAGAVLFLGARGLSADEHYEQARDVDLTQLGEMEYMAGPRCLEQAAKPLGTSKIWNPQSATAASAP